MISSKEYWKGLFLGVFDEVKMNPQSNFNGENIADEFKQWLVTKRIIGNVFRCLNRLKY